VIVVDASVTLAWCLADEADEYADRMLDRVVQEGAVAPAQWPLEVANGLRSAERRGRLTETDIARATQLLADLGIEVVPVELPTATGAVLATAREHDLSAYDAAYLDLASFRSIALATIDEALRRACEQAGVQAAD
jgi:predicted nucleic acid-binding protein